jgi:OFA family oxalate/formate antiporter-like MFS transporter
VVGFAFGGTLALMPAFTADFFGTKNLGINYGGLFTAYGVAGGVLSLFAIQVRVATGAWTSAFWYLVIACAAGLALTFITRAPAPKEAEAKA